jgi:hypothetical protein
MAIMYSFISFVTLRGRTLGVRLDVKVSTKAPSMGTAFCSRNLKLKNVSVYTTNMIMR